MEEKIRKIFSDQEFAKDFFESESAAEAQKKLSAKGLSLSAEQIEKVFEAAKSFKECELSDKDLENVSGGTIPITIEIIFGALIAGGAGYGGWKVISEND